MSKHLKKMEIRSLTISGGRAFQREHVESVFEEQQGGEDRSGVNRKNSRR